MNTITLEDFPKICRLCLSPGELKSILGVQIICVFKSITNIEVKQDDHFPENICKKCSSQLEKICSFIDVCRKNDEYLRNLITQHYDKSKDAPDDENYTSDSFNDIKSESSDSENCGNEIILVGNVKEEIISEPDEASIKLKNYNNSVSCKSCNENFPTKLAHLEHYGNSPECRSDDYITTDEVPNILNYLKKNDVKKSNNKIKIEDEYDDNGKKLKGKRKYLCSYCGKNYTRKNGLDRHILSHTGVKPFECRECGKRYITKDTLKTHMLTHTGVRAHKCEVCQKSFTQSSHLSYHMRRHAGEKPHTCMFCNKAFLSTYHLERHKLMHTGVKPYECNQCGKQFVRSTTLRDHLLIHSGEKPFQCQHCGRQFSRKQCLTNHVLAHTGQSKGNSGNIGQNLNCTESNSISTGY